jgi:pimeloyl-ACP methyl ester carboxylesterase
MGLLTRIRGLGWPWRVALGMALFLLVAVVYARWDSRVTGLKSAFLRETPHATDLIVFTHGFERGPEAMNAVTEAVAAEYPAADLLMYEYSSQAFSNADPFKIAAQIEDSLGDIYDKRRYARIRLVGYSMGALLLRKAFVYGSGHVEDYPFSDAGTLAKRDPQEWVNHVDRIVLLAGMNRGWRNDQRPEGMQLWRRVVQSVGVFIGRISGTGNLILSMQAGSPFVANLRLQWLDTFNPANQPASHRLPAVVQLLGDKDDVVSRDDNRDVKVSKGFVWVTVHDTDHSDILVLDDTVAGQKRRSSILQALGDDAAVERLRFKALRERTKEELDADAESARIEMEDVAVTSVVFVVHGIRDMGDWTQDFQKRLEQRHAALHPGSPELIRIHTPSYGYFAMGPFLLWGDRQYNVRWFMDQVTEVKARYPNLRHMHFIGHSNGTYVLASALKKYNTLTIDNVIFAGSVVPRDYPWRQLGSRVGKVRNYVASDDLVVGIFPHLFEVPGFTWMNSDLGSAGFNGFTDDHFKTFETRFIEGGHGAALRDENRQNMIDFILEGRMYDADTIVVKTRPALVGVVSRLCWLVWILLVALIITLGILSVRFARRQYAKAPRKVSKNMVTGAAGAGYAMFIVLLLYTI